MQSGTHILLVTGPAGVGKSTVCWEMGALLAAAGLPHAIIESDELDRVFPRPSAQDLEALQPGATDVSAVNLAALWKTYQALGHSRLIMSGVMLHPGHDRRWVLAAIPEARITLVRLIATEDTLTARLDRRETGSGRNAQLQRTLRQARRMADERLSDVVRVCTDGATPQSIAEAVLRSAGWLS